MSARLDGISSNYSLFAALPAEARAEMKNTLAQIAKKVLAEQQKLVPVYDGKPRKGVVPGKLKGSLTIAEAMQGLRVWIGYPKMRGGRHGLFYGVIIENGRKAGVVTYRRLSKANRAEWLVWIKEGRARAKVKPTALGSLRTMNVKARAPQRFVHIENTVAHIVDNALADFWTRLLPESGR